MGNGWQMADVIGRWMTLKLPETISLPVPMRVPSMYDRDSYIFLHQMPNIAEGCRGRVYPWLFSYCKSICHLWTLSINAMANWSIHEITQCGHDPRKATCVTPACHRVLLSRPGSALLSPAYDGITDGVKFRIRSVNFVDSASASVDVKKMPTDFLFHNAEQKDMGFHACDLKLSTNVIQIVSTHQHHPLLHLRWSGWVGQVPWHMVLGSWLINIYLLCKHSNRSLQCAVCF